MVHQTKAIMLLVEAWFSLGYCNYCLLGGFATGRLRALKNEPMVFSHGYWLGNTYAGNTTPLLNNTCLSARAALSCYDIAKNATAE